MTHRRSSHSQSSSGWNVGPVLCHNRLSNGLWVRCRLTFYRHAHTVSTP